MGFEFEKLSEYEEKALSYVERYGIIEYKVEGNKLYYTESFPTEGDYDVVVDLDTNKELSRKKVK